MHYEKKNYARTIIFCAELNLIFNFTFHELSKVPLFMHNEAAT